MTTVLHIEELSRSFGGLKAVSDVTLDIEEHEVHCLIGPNGAGKSTLFKLIMGTYEPSGGRVMFLDRDITAAKPFERIKRGMSIKMQVPSIFKNLTVVQNLKVSLQSFIHQNVVDDELDRLLTFLDLTEHAGKSAGALAHGHQQWLEIGMALAVQPKLLLLDEPTAGMSPEETFNTGELIQRLNHDGMTVLVVEHDMAFIRQIAQRVTVLHFGQIFKQGSMDEVAADPGVAEIYLGKTDAR